MCKLLDDLMEVVEGTCTHNENVSTGSHREHTGPSVKQKYGDSFRVIAYFVYEVNRAAFYLCVKVVESGDRKECLGNVPIRFTVTPLFILASRLDTSYASSFRLASFSQVKSTPSSCSACSDEYTHDSGREVSRSRPCICTTRAASK